jgi:hypothetical protein
MKKHYKLAMIPVLITLAACATTIESYKITKRDQQAYASEAVSQEDYNQKPFVLKTRGDGAIVCITLGEKDGIKKNTKITFYKVDKANNKKYKVPFAEGRVFIFGPDTAWVEVKGGSSAGVHKGHFATTANDQSYTFGEKMLFPPRFFMKN